MDSAETGKEPTEILANTEIPEQFGRMLAVAPGLDDQRRVGRQPVSAASLAVTHCRSPSEGEGDGEMFSGDTAYGNQRDVEE
ncbi:Os02g0499150 [Oryza sativa Japonica Group]|uniref:Os02g0499150 protein n=1 Tax=Oryza sativa subsp. japonica TaxID=39947 RepID=A0A0P0VJB0_ORYSJ|nr:Os02g0499150 [Oryza sativa Japonica Group]